MKGFFIKNARCNKKARGPQIQEKVIRHGSFGWHIIVK
jgi:hypothetical protein